MNGFVFGEDLEYGLDIKRLDPPPDKDLWELRSYSERPYLRVIGSFALPRWFIGVAHSARDDLEDQRGGPKWKKVLSEAVTARDQLLDGELHFSGHTVKAHY